MQQWQQQKKKTISLQKICIHQVTWPYVHYCTRNAAKANWTRLIHFKAEDLVNLCRQHRLHNLYWISHLRAKHQENETWFKRLGKLVRLTYTVSSCAVSCSSCGFNFHVIKDKGEKHASRFFFLVQLLVKVCKMWDWWQNTLQFEVPSEWIKQLIPVHRCTCSESFINTFLFVCAFKNRKEKCI